MTTLVLCVDRTNDIGRKTGLRTPVSGWEAVQSLVVDVGLADPEDTSVNCLLEALRVARDLRDEREEAVVAVVSGESDSLVGADRSVAAQLDELVETYDPESVVVVVDSAEDERLVPVIESRLRVDAVDRIVVRQARDIESTYYLLKQFLADEELRQTVLVPMGIGLLLLPLLLLRFESPALAGAFIASLLGAVLLYKGLAIGERLASVPERTRDALYSGQVSVVTYVVAAGLTLVGVFLGGLEASSLSSNDGIVVAAIQFAYSSVPWLALAALTASTGRLVDELIQNDEVGSPYWNLPFGVVALGLVIRGFTGWYLERQEIIPQASIPGLMDSVPATYRLAAFVVAGLVVSIVGVAVASNVADETLDVR